MDLTVVNKYGETIDLSNGYREGSEYYPATLFKAYQNNEKLKPLIEAIIDDFLVKGVLKDSNEDEELECKFCNGKAFNLKYGSCEIIATCPTCKWETSVYSG